MLLYSLNSLLFLNCALERNFSCWIRIWETFIENYFSWFSYKYKFWFTNPFHKNDWLVYLSKWVKLYFSTFLNCASRWTINFWLSIRVANSSKISKDADAVALWMRSNKDLWRCLAKINDLRFYRLNIFLIFDVFPWDWIFIC